MRFRKIGHFEAKMALKTLFRRIARMLPGIFELPIVPRYHIQKLFLFGKLAAKKYVLTPLYVITYLSSSPIKFFLDMRVRMFIARF